MNRTRNRIFGIILVSMGVSTVILACANLKTDSNWILGGLTAVVTTILGIGFIED